ncbi:MAG TPA: pyridoxal kinase [Hyphomicrobiaceae bacterium]|jgi:pyridoxine kinase
MARVLAFSSQVVRGHVGLSAIVPALQRLGHEVWPLPSIILSNHPGHPHAAGMRVETAVLEEVVDALDRNGWLGEIDAAITGYLPSAEHACLAASVIRRLRANGKLTYLCDPVLGDEPKGLYIEAAAAAAIRDELVPLADIITPNRFELSWLSDIPIKTDDVLPNAARGLAPATVLVTSARRRGPMLENLLIDEDGVKACEVPYRESVPHGTGDLFSALVLGHHLNGATETSAMAFAAAGVEQAILASAGRDELALVASQEAWVAAKPLEVSQWHAG